MNQIENNLTIHIPKTSLGDANPVEPTAMDLSHATSLVHFYEKLPIKEKPSFQGPLVARALQIKTWMEGVGHDLILECTALELDNAGLTSLPPEIGLFRNLVSLSLMSNSLTHLPSEIGQLKKLKTLILSGNSLVDLPLEMGQLTQLRELHLAYNQLSTIPTAIARCTQLQHLYLSHNRISHLPGSFGELYNLSLLDLSQNEFVTIPSSLLYLPEQCQILLQENPLDPNLLEQFLARDKTTPEIITDTLEETRRLYSTHHVRLAIQTGDPRQVQRLIESRIDVNARDTHGLTALQYALSCNKLDVGKLIVENSEVANTEDMQALLQRMGNVKIKPFRPERPAPYIPQIFHDGRFVSLFSFIQEQPHAFQELTKPLALVNMADEYLEMGPSAILKCFGPAQQVEYEKIARTFTLVRVIVNKPNQLVSTIDRIQEMIPQLPLNYWALVGHGNASCMVLDFNKKLTIHDTSIMQSIAGRVSPVGSLALWGCNCAETDVNITRQFSNCAEGRLVCGSACPVAEIAHETFYTGVTQTPVLIPYFKANPELQAHTRIYQCNEELLLGNNRDDRPHFEQLVSNLENVEEQPSEEITTPLENDSELEALLKRIGAI